MREYPKLADINQAYRPLSLVCVHFSGDIDHNFRKSQATLDPVNQVIEIDNRGNIFFSNLGDAMLAGIAKAVHPIVAIVHEDVLLPDHWQQHLERSLVELERHDPDWAMLGAGGWTVEGKFEGHLSDPHNYYDTLADACFREVERIDEQIIILKNDGRLLPDTALPSIHNIGRDLASAGRRMGRRTYVVNAPTIHKFADAFGTPIQSREDSPKIVDRSTLAYKADFACSAEYYRRKWDTTAPAAPKPVTRDPRKIYAMNRPVILLGHGEEAARLLAVAAEDCGWFLGGGPNGSGDALDLVAPVYAGVVRKFACKAEWQKEEIVPQLRRAAGSGLKKADWPRRWGIAVAESVYLVPELAKAFPSARYVHLVGDPLTSAWRAPPLAGRLDNQIGRTVIPAAYDHFRRPRSQILEDSAAMRVAVTTAYQYDLVLAALDRLPILTLTLESVLQAPREQSRKLAAWLGGEARSDKLADEAAAYAAGPVDDPAAAVRTQVAGFLGPLRSRLNYV